jgi:ComF family protein
MAGFIKQGFNYLLDSLYPNICPGCGEVLPTYQDNICLLCEFALPVTGYHTYENNPVKNIFKGRIPLKHASSYMIFTHQGLARKLMHDIKYNGNKELAVYLGKKFARSIGASEFACSLNGIIPMPIHPQKKATRGYNQAEEIAKGMSDILKIPLLSHVVARVENSNSQTTLNREKRWNNVKDAFSLVSQEDIKGKHILLLDDTLTTGATLEALGQTILSKTGCHISMAALASVV